MKHIHNLLDLFIHKIEKLYAAEQQIESMMPQIIGKVQHGSLKNALTHHANLTREQKQRLETIPSLIKDKNLVSCISETPHVLNSNPNKAIQGIVEEAEELLSADISKEVIDAALISIVQKIEHYEISAYGTALAYARQLHLHKVESLLQESLNEEYDADDLLTALATAALNKEALPEGIEQQVEQNTYVSAPETETRTAKVSISERTINSPGGRAGTSHRGYGNGESRGH